MTTPTIIGICLTTFLGYAIIAGVVYALLACPRSERLLIARADKVEEQTGRAYTMASGWAARRDMAHRILKLLEREAG
jgi:hypothetical protein